MRSQPAKAVLSNLSSKYQTVRSTTRSVADGLSAEDQMIQSCPEASPVKWHQAHTTWFFETFVLREFLKDYEPFRDKFRWLFNSYYNSLGDEIVEKKLRASFSRPSLDEVVAFRAHVDKAMERLLAGPVDDEAERRIVLGLNHEQQHQELALTDIKHAFFSNPLHPSFAADPLLGETDLPAAKLEWHSFKGGLIEIGYPLQFDDPLDFCFDNETPRHKVYLEPFQIANREVTCGEYLEFMADDAYRRPEFWLSAGWETVKGKGWQAPLYWQRDASDKTGWRSLHAAGLDRAHHADRCAGVSYQLVRSRCIRTLAGLPTSNRSGMGMRRERIDAKRKSIGYRTPAPRQGARRGHPATLRGLLGVDGQRLHRLSGIQTSPRALGEYNGKFMSGQMVLRGGSCVTPADHIRATYRNFFQPETRWQFSGLRLAK